MSDKNKKELPQSTIRPMLPDIPTSPGLMAPVGVKESENDGMLSAPKNIQNHISLHTKYLETLLRRNHREQVDSAQVMRQLTTKFGTKGKSAKKIFLQAFADDMRKSGTDKDCGCITEEEKERLKRVATERRKTATEDTEQPPAPFIGKERPAAIVSDKQSSFVRYLMEVVQNELHRVGCLSPTFDRDKGIEAAKRDYVKMTADFQNGHVYNLKEIARDQIKDDTIVDSEEKMIARLKIYSRAFSAVILHFTALRPILLDIKRNYDSILALKNQQMVDLRIVKKTIAYKEKYIDAYMEDFRFECYEEMAEMERQSYKLMKHIDKQDAAIKTMTDVLNKLDNTLGEEHELRRDADDQKKMLTAEVNVYRKKLGMSLRTDENQPGLVSEEIVVTDDVEEEEALSTEDPLILRRALVTCRKNLSDIQSRLTVLEAEYEGVIPRRQFTSLTLEKAELEFKHEALLESYTALQPQVQSLKHQLDKLMAERPVVDEDEEEEDEEEEEDAMKDMVEVVSGPPPIPPQYDNYAGRMLVELANSLGVPILSAEKEDDPLGDTEVNMQQFYKAIITANPEMSEERVATTLAWVFVGVATPTGQERKGLMLLNYVKSKLNLSMEDQEMSQLAIEFDDEDFERAIRAITIHLPVPEEEAQLTIQQKRQHVKKYKVTRISNVIKRVKDAPFLRYSEADDDMEGSNRHIRYSI